MKIVLGNKTVITRYPEQCEEEMRIGKVKSPFNIELWPAQKS